MCVAPEWSIAGCRTLWFSGCGFPLFRERLMSSPSYRPSTRTKQTTYILSLTNSIIMLYCSRLIGAPGLFVPASLMRPRRAVLQTPPESSVPPRLLFYKSSPPLTHSKSTLLQLLIPLHFNSPRINTYKKTGGGGASFQPQSFATRHYPHIARLRAHSNAPNSNRFYGLFQGSPDSRVWGSSSSPFAHLELCAFCVKTRPILGYCFQKTYTKSNSFICNTYKIPGGRSPTRPSYGL